MEKRKVLSFFVLLTSFVLILLVIEASQFGSIAGYSTAGDLEGLEVSSDVMKTATVYMLGFFVFSFVVMFGYRLYRKNEAVKSYGRNIDGRYVKLNVNR